MSPGHFHKIALVSMSFSIGIGFIKGDFSIIITIVTQKINKMGYVLGIDTDFANFGDHPMTLRRSGADCSQSAVIIHKVARKLFERDYIVPKARPCIVALAAAEGRRRA